MSTIDELLKANEAYAATFDRGHLPLPPARRIAIVTCMDARILPSRALGLEEGDAHVIRNAGGRARDALRSIIISQRLLGTREVWFINPWEWVVGGYARAGDGYEEFARAGGQETFSSRLLSGLSFSVQVLWPRRRSA